MPIDYSKWDKIEDSDDEDEAPELQQPRVTQLEAASRITTRADGSLDITQSATSSSSSTALPKQQADNTDNNWTRNGSYIESHQLYWSQDRYQVTLRFRHTTQAKKLRVNWTGMIYTYEERHSACGGSSNLASFIVHVGDEQILKGSLPHVIHYHQDEDEIDWSIDHCGNDRFLVLVLPKASPMYGVSINWKRPLLEVPEEERQQEKASGESFQQAWNEAHRQFKEKVKNGELKGPPNQL